MSIDPVTFDRMGPSGLSQSASGGTAAAESPAAAFGRFLSEAISEADTRDKEAETSVAQLAGGSQVDLHQTMIALEKVDVAFQLLMQVRNKIIAAYEEISRMQV